MSEQRMAAFRAWAMSGQNPQSNWIIEREDARGLFEQLESTRNGCEQALLLLERERFADDPEAKVVRAVLKSALASSPASEPEAS